MSLRQPIRPVVLRNGGTVEHPLEVALAFLIGNTSYDRGSGSRPESFDESDLRHANRGGARISAVEIATILARRRGIDRALRAIPLEASLAGPASSVPWLPLESLFEAFAEVRGVGLSKMTKALHPKRPGLIPILDSVVQAYLQADDPGTPVPLRTRGPALVRGYKRDLDRNRSVLRALRRELTGRGHELTEVRILDLLIWSAASTSGIVVRYPNDRRV